MQALRSTEHEPTLFGISSHLLTVATLDHRET
jgi:hypothetical protein